MVRPAVTLLDSMCRDLFRGPATSCFCPQIRVSHGDSGIGRIWHIAPSLPHRSTVSINNPGQAGHLHHGGRLHVHPLKPIPVDKHCYLMNSNRLLLTDETSPFQGTDIPRPFDSRATVPDGFAPSGLWTNAVALVRIVRSSATRSTDHVYLS